jgi:hypothetical protein
MNRLGINFINMENIIWYKVIRESFLIIRFFNHPFLLWDPIIQCFFIKIELYYLYKYFNYPSPEKLFVLLHYIEEGREDS